MKETKGITLIALIITIIIMLILAGVVIAILVNGGLFEEANNAVELTTIGREKEWINIAYGTELAKSKNNSGENSDEDEPLSTVSFENEIRGLKGDDNVTVEDKGDKTYKITYTDSNRSYDIDIESGIIKELINFETAKKHPDQVNSDDIGLDDEGKPVNLDLWRYILIPEGHEDRGEVGTYELSDVDSVEAESIGKTSYGPAYVGEIMAEGKIIGNMPAYIKEIDEDGEGEFLKVTGLYFTFVGLSDLTEINIASTVTRIGYYAFGDCKNLKKIIVPAGIQAVREQDIYSDSPITIYYRGNHEEDSFEWNYSWNVTDTFIYVSNYTGN